jgi:hypothetical protein
MSEGKKQKTTEKPKRGKESRSISVRYIKYVEGSNVEMIPIYDEEVILDNPFKDLLVRTKRDTLFSLN